MSNEKQVELLGEFNDQEVSRISQERSFHLPQETNLQRYGRTNFKWKKKPP